MLYTFYVVPLVSFTWFWEHKWIELKIDQYFLPVKGYGHDLGQTLFFNIYCLQCSSNISLIINLNLSFSRRVICKIHSSQLFIMQTRVQCFSIRSFNIPVKDLFSSWFIPSANYIFNINKNFLAFVTFIFGLNLEFSLYSKTCPELY